MASLQNEQIDQSYQGLIKTANNTSGAPFPPANLQYGDGNNLPILIGDGTSVGIGDIVSIVSGSKSLDVNSSGIGITGLTNIDGAGGTAAIVNGTFNFGIPGGVPATSVDFSNATVTGLPAGAAGLENGTGTDSLQSAAALTTNPADASGNGSIAIGDGAEATRQESVAIGQGAQANGSGSEGSIAIGHGAQALSNRGIAIGINGTSNSAEGIAIGDSVDIGSGADRVIALGNSINVASTGADDSIVIGTQAASDGSRGVTVGRDAKVTGAGGIAIGDTAGYITGSNTKAISIGRFSGFGNGVESVQVGDSATAKAAQGICVGHNARIERTESTEAIAIGHLAGGVSTSDYGSGFIAIGKGAKIDGTAGTVDVGGAIVIGKDARASAEDAVALGKDVVASTASTVSVKALETQTDGGVNIKGDGTNAGKLKLYCEDASGAHNVTLEGPAHAGGQTYSLKFPNVQSAGSQILEADSSGNLSWIDTPGGGGGAQGAYTPMNNSGMDGVIPYASATAGPNYRTTRLLTGTGLGQAYNPGTDSAYYELIAMQELSTISQLVIEVDTAAAAGSTAEIAIYDTNVLNGMVNGNTKLQSLGTIDTATTGQKVLSLATPFAMPSGKTNGQVMIVVWPSDHNVRFKGWNSVIGAGSMKQYGSTWYWTKSTFIKPGVTPGTTLPASLSGVARWAQVQNPIAIWYS